VKRPTIKFSPNRLRRGVSPLEKLERARRRRRQVELAWLVGVSVFAAGVLVSSAIASVSMFRPFCSACHQASAQTLDASAHADLNCDACHGGATFFEVADRRLNTVSMVVSWAVPGDQAVVASVPNQMCLECHASGVSGVIERRGLRMSHREVMAAKWTCTRCHPDAGHGQTRDRRYAYSMDSCLECHSVNPLNIGSCAQCHVDEGYERDLSRNSQWSLVHGKDWRRTHGLGNLRTCRACHEDSKCIGCHGLPMPHDRNFAQQHGRVVLSAEGMRDKCLTCHKQSLCDGCHGIDMPHPQGFLKTHADLVAEGQTQVCERCHLQESCDACHTAHIHPGINEKWLRALKANPVKN
jgi:hypothetical protein